VAAPRVEPPRAVETPAPALWSRSGGYRATRSGAPAQRCRPPPGSGDCCSSRTSGGGKQASVAGRGRGPPPQPPLRLQDGGGGKRRGCKGSGCGCGCGCRGSGCGCPGAGTVSDGARTKPQRRLVPAGTPSAPGASGTETGTGRTRSGCGGGGRPGCGCGCGSEGCGCCGDGVQGTRGTCCGTRMTPSASQNRAGAGSRCRRQLVLIEQGSRCLPYHHRHPRWQPDPHPFNNKQQNKI
jgi:hypothetical protein